jgi:hypothetical protein
MRLAAGLPGSRRTSIEPRGAPCHQVQSVERYFNLVQRTVDINRRLAVRCAEAVGTLSGVGREKAESAGDLVREKAEAAGNVVRERPEKAEQAALEQADKAEQAEKELAHQARQAEREQARRARERARERYEGLAKAELSDLLATRELPKTGNFDELIERLVEADSK